MTPERQTGTLSLPMVAKRKPLIVLYPEFGNRLESRLHRNGIKLTNKEVAGLTGAKEEMVRRYRKGLARPDDDDVERKLAALVGMTQAELRWGTPTVPGVKTVPVAQLAPEEQTLVESYRSMPPGAQKMLRIRAAELLEQFGEPSKENPWGKASKKPRKTGSSTN